MCVDIVRFGPRLLLAHPVVIGIYMIAEPGSTLWSNVYGADKIHHCHLHM